MNQPLAVFVDGERRTPDGQLDWPLDRGLHYGDGLFETMIARDGHIRFVSLHRARLAAGCSRLRITIAQAPLWEQASILAQQLGNAVLKLLVTRGAMTQRGYGISGNEPGRSLLFAYAAPEAIRSQEVNVVSLQATLGQNAGLAGIKHCNRLEQVLATMELKATDAFEGLLSSSCGHLISGTMSNVFLDTDVGLVTPSLQLCGIAGVTRAVVLREAAAMGIPIHVADVPLAVLDECRGLFLTNVRLGVLPATRLNGRELASGDQSRALAARVAALEN
jgi:4-amino-4-deoxychorismate lyase